MNTCTMRSNQLSWHALGTELADLVFPTQCVGCGVWDTRLCERCSRISLRARRGKPMLDSAGLPTFPIFTLGKYEGALRKLVLTAKHQDEHGLNHFLEQAGRVLGREVARWVGASFSDLGNANGVRSLPPLAVVPAPSSHKRKRQRKEIVPVIADLVATALTAWLGQRVPVCSAVTLRWGARSQSGADRKKRSAGRSGAMGLVHPLPNGSWAVLVDDVVTTGATLKEMASLLEPRVLGAATLAQA